ncbi:MAG: hypothetical protein ACUVXI_05415 [bacterium]
MFRNPIFEESLKFFFLHNKTLVFFLYCILVLGAMLFFIWPDGDAEVKGAPPSSFRVISIAILVLVAYLNLTASSRTLALRDMHKLSDWVKLTPLSLRTIVVGKFMVSALYSALFLVIASPFIVIATSISGMSVWEVLLIELYAWGFALVYYGIGLYLSAVWEDEETILFIVERAVFAVLMVATIFILPAINPILFVDSLATGYRAKTSVFTYRVPFPGFTPLIHLALLSILVWLLIVKFKKWRIAESREAL